MTGTSIRKIVTIVQETRTEIGQKIDPPSRQCAAIAVIANPYAGRYSQELPKLEAAGAELVALDVLDPESIASAMAGASAVVCCTGFTPSLNFKKDNPAKVDHVGTDNLVAAAGNAKGSVKKFVLVTSLLTNARASGQADNDNYKFLNALGGVLDEKLAAELNLRGSGLDYTIVRPGGLSNEPESVTGPVIVRGEDTTFGLPTDPGREISRDTVAAVCVEALFAKNASNRVVEIVASPDAPKTSPDTWFA